jgi:hypothetical protein
VDARTSSGLIPADAHVLNTAAKHHFGESFVTMTPQKARQAQHKAKARSSLDRGTASSAPSVQSGGSSADEKIDCILTSKFPEIDSPTDDCLPDSFNHSFMHAMQAVSGNLLAESRFKALEKAVGSLQQQISWILPPLSGFHHHDLNLQVGWEQGCDPRLLAPGTWSRLNPEAPSFVPARRSKYVERW